MFRPGYGIAEAARLAGLELYQVQKFTEAGWVTASVRASSGRGGPSKQRIYSPDDVRRLKVIGTLYGAGLRRSEIRRVLDYLDQSGIHVPQDGILVSNTRRVMLVDREERCFDVLRQFQGAFSLFLGIDIPPMPRPVRAKRRPPLLTLPSARARARLARTG